MLKQQQWDNQVNTTFWPHVSTPLFCLSLCTLGKSVTQVKRWTLVLICSQHSSIPKGHSRLYKGPNGAKLLVTVGYTHTDNNKKNLCKPRTKPEIPAERARQYVYKHTNKHTVTQCCSPVLTACCKTFGLLATSSLFIRYDSHSIFAP